MGNCFFFAASGSVLRSSIRRRWSFHRLTFKHRRPQVVKRRTMAAATVTLSAWAHLSPPSTKISSLAPTTVPHCHRQVDNSSCAGPTNCMTAWTTVVGTAAAVTTWPDPRQSTRTWQQLRSCDVGATSTRRPWKAPTPMRSALQRLTKSQQRAVPWLGWPTKTRSWWPLTSWSSKMTRAFPWRSQSMSRPVFCRVPTPA